MTKPASIMPPSWAGAVTMSAAMSRVWNGIET
jgi:hypothetical protein